MKNILKKYFFIINISFRCKTILIILRRQIHKLTLILVKRTFRILRIIYISPKYRVIILIFQFVLILTANSRVK